MILYVLVAVVPLVVGAFYKDIPFVDEKYNIRRRFRWLLMASLPMFLLIALRHGSIGPDTGIYNWHFTEAITKTWEEMYENTRMEQGYLIFVKLITYITHNVLVFQIIYTTIYWLAIVDFANQLEKENFLFLFLYATIGIYLFMFTGIRQCIAMCLCLFSYRFIKNRKIIPFAVLIFIAFYFHKCSIIFALSYILYALQFNILTTLGYIVATIFAFFNIEFIQNWFNAQLDYEYELESTGNGYIAILVMLCLTVYSVFAVLNQKNPSKEKQGLLNIGIVTMIFWILRLATRVAERPSYFFMFFLLAIFAESICQINNKRDRSAIRFLVILLFLLYYIYKLSNIATLVPYKFY